MQSAMSELETSQSAVPESSVLDDALFVLPNFRSIQAESRLSGLRPSISRPTLSERILQFLRAQDQQDSVQASSSFLSSYRHDKQRQALKFKLLGLLLIQGKINQKQ
jgi:hypothetical protein